MTTDAEAMKNDANRLFQAGKYDEACKGYSRAIELDPTIAALWANRAFAQTKLEMYGAAIADANECLKLDPNYIKAYYRRATAFLALMRYQDALKDLRTVAKHAPRDPDARQKLAEVEKIVKRIEFEKALSYDEDQTSVADTIDLTSIKVDQDYDGMHWQDDEPISESFVMDMINRFTDQKKIHRRYAYRIMLEAKALLDALPPLVHVKVPREGGCLTICGDVHGQYYDLVNIFKKNGFPSAKNAYLFNGDFVDRGSFSAEVILTLLAFKVLYPKSFFLSRGNHETNNMNRMYGFEGEVRHKYTETMFKLFSELFNGIPLCNVVENQLFIVHGGLPSQDGVKLKDIEALNRFQQPPSEGLMSDLLWSDPQPANGRSPSKRGVGMQFGPDITKRFLDDNNLSMLIRSHEVRDYGYEIEHDGKCVTVFSAPNYCDSIGNKGAYINVTLKNEGDEFNERPELNLEYFKFEAVPHPNVKPMQYAGPYSGMFGL